MLNGAYTHVGLGGVCMRKRLNFTLSEACVCRLRELAECVYHKPMSQVVELLIMGEAPVQVDPLSEDFKKLGAVLDKLESLVEGY